MKSCPAIIALVEDNQCLRETLDYLLRTAGYQVRAFCRGEDFVSAAQSSQFDCMLLDVELGTCTGFEIAADPCVSNKKIPTIFMSGSVDPQIPVRAIEAGCVAFLRKPFLADALLDTLSRALPRAAGNGQT